MGSNVQAKIYYTTSLLCSSGNLPVIDSNIVDDGFILMADRGECSFVEKARHAMQVNASALIIADNVCLCQNQPQCQSETCENWEPVMDDDGTGHNIRIPSMLVVKQEADFLKSALQSGTEITLRLSYPLPKTEGGVVKYALWTTPEDQTSHQFLQSFQHAAIELGDRAIFEPFMLIEDGSVTGCHANGNANNKAPPSCDGQCTNGGRYCAPSFHDDLQNYQDKGTKLVIESLRRECIWDIYGSANGIGREWWSYIKNWITVCAESHYSTICAEGLYADSGVDKDKVDECMTNAGGFGSDKANSVLDYVLDSARDSKVVFAPAVFVNGALVRGELSFGTVLGAICATWEDSNAPAICSQWETCWSTCQSEQCILKPDSTCTKFEERNIPFEISDFDDDIVSALDDETSTVVTTTASPATKPTNSPATEMSQPDYQPTEQFVDMFKPPPTTAPTRAIFGRISSPTKAPSAQIKRPIVVGDGVDKPLDDWPSIFDRSEDEDSPEIIEIIHEREGGNTASFFAGLGIGFGVMMMCAVCYLVRLIKKPPRLTRSNSSRSLEQLIFDDLRELDLERKFVCDRRYLGDEDGGEDAEKRDVNGEDAHVLPSRYGESHVGGSDLGMEYDDSEMPDTHEISFGADEEFVNSDDEYDDDHQEIHTAEFT